MECKATMTHVKSHTASFLSSIGEKLTVITFLAVIAVQSWAFLFVPTDFNGDPNDYVGIAMNSFQGISTIRMFGYPIFLSIFSFNFSILNLIFVAQSIIFLVCLRYFAFALVSRASLRWIVYVVALIPSVAYTQKLLFPDGLILSLMLLFLGLLMTKRFVALIVVSLVLVSIKIVFIFLFVVVFAIYAIERSWISIKLSFLLSNLLLLLMITAVFVVSPSTIYQTTVQAPNFVSDELSGPKFPEETSFTCGSIKYKLLDVISAEEATTHTSDVMTPLTGAIASELGCQKTEVAALQRELIAYYFNQSPETQTKKFLLRFWGGLTGNFQVNHVAYMLSVKNQLIEADPWGQYTQLEIDYFSSHGLVPPLQPAEIIIHYSYILSYELYRALCVASAVLLFGLAVFRKLGKGYLGQSQKIEYKLFLFAFSYNILIAANGFTYDRYLFINGFILAAGVASAISNLYRPPLVQIQNK
jgi:hypothetical protein